MQEFTCAVCKGDFFSNRPNEECWKEFYELTPEAEHDLTDMVCDDCFEEHLEWFKKLSDDQKKALREYFIKEKYH